MTTLYIDRKHACLAAEGRALVVHFNGERQRPVPMALLERVVLLGSVQLDSGVLLTLAEAGIAVQLGSPRQPGRRALVLGAGHHDAELRLLQYRLSLDEAFRVQFARGLVQAKLRAQQRLLGRMGAERPDQHHALTTAQAQLAALAESLAGADSRATLLGLEGSAARVVFQALAVVLPAGLAFEGRKRRPPPDAVNACLSLAYTLLHGRAVQMLHARGLDPLLGFYHETAWGRESLASDLIEPWRPYIDEWVWDVFRKQYLHGHHFKQENGGCFLGKAGRPLFFASLEERLRSISRAMRLQVRGLLAGMQAWEQAGVVEPLR